MYIIYFEYFNRNTSKFIIHYYVSRVVYFFSDDYNSLPLRTASLLRENGDIFLTVTVKT